MRVAALLLLIPACQNMRDQPKHKPFRPSTFFADGTSARPIIPGTVARGHLRLDLHFYTGRVDGGLADTFPFPITHPVLRRGQERYNIFCAPCHSRTGDGNGMIVRRGFSRPPSFHIDRLRQAPLGHFFDVITYGYGLMYSYASRVSPGDRWAIIAYIRALQLSQNVQLAELSPEERQQLQGARR
ncbi:MAG: cytochrome c [Candidatus Tectomicrobia bacterium]|uniref:Cytochrome c n=1 Tax=Tectimicrobiota bacterium TaxID=2528274 RepID=A0A932CPA9_UNCTE|nr:cytochrome c [Candidatus Tectomicrobia bacterium]